MNSTLLVLVKLTILVLGYLITLATSGVVVHFFVGKREKGYSAKASPPAGRRDLGMIIGKCENLLAISFIIAGEFTALALIFAAKSIVRMEDIKEDPEYYLGGTIVNFTYSVLAGLVIKQLLAAQPQLTCQLASILCLSHMFGSLCP